MTPTPNECKLASLTTKGHEVTTSDEKQSRSGISDSFYNRVDTSCFNFHSFGEECISKENILT